jgi:hypothetical protein
MKSPYHTRIHGNIPATYIVDGDRMTCEVVDWREVSEAFGMVVYQEGGSELASRYEFRSGSTSVVYVQHNSQDRPAPLTFLGEGLVAVLAFQHVALLDYRAPRVIAKVDVTPIAYEVRRFKEDVLIVSEIDLEMVRLDGTTRWHVGLPGICTDYLIDGEVIKVETDDGPPIALDLNTGQPLN